MAASFLLYRKAISLVFQLKRPSRFVKLGLYIFSIDIKRKLKLNLALINSTHAVELLIISKSLNNIQFCLLVSICSIKLEL
jgi:hypothetical protein